MNMIVCAANGKREHVMVFADGGNIRPEPWLNLFCNELLPIFGAENQVNVVLRVAVRQGVAPPALGSLCYATHRFRGGLGSLRASGALKSIISYSCALFTIHAALYARTIPQLILLPRQTPRA